MPSKRVSPSSSGTSRLRSRSSPFARSRTSAPRPPRKQPWPSQGSSTPGPPAGGPEPFARPIRHPRDRRMPVLASAGLMFLKSLTLRGFKSFADKTVLDFEPGITVVVGPNGSGKSNVVDALSWVLGTHSAKSLRGGSMSDVIFAGAPGRPALGRAAVDITIDNTAGTLPIDFSEVTVSRAMFASGENDYAINSVACRLLDVQELLSDTGLGRENHTIVGQGQLDAILNAKPEDRRAFIEEAAGILKHRRRKERALRKLAQTEQHLERLTDLLRELRRQLRPLERQAEAAAKAAELQTALREVRVERALRELAAVTLSVTSDEAARALSADRITERHRGLTAVVEEPVAGRDPEQLRALARTERGALTDLEAEHATAR